MERNIQVLQWTRKEQVKLPSEYWTVMREMWEALLSAAEDQGVRIQISEYVSPEDGTYTVAIKYYADAE